MWLNFKFKADMRTYKYIVSIFILTGLTLVSCKDTATIPNENMSTTTTDQQEQPRIVHVDIDTLLNKYELYQDRKASLETESKAAESSLGAKIEAFQNRVAKMQQEFAQAQQNAANIAPVDLKKLEEKFMKQQQNLAKEEESLMKQRDNAARDLDNKLQTLQKDLQDKIDDYLAKIADEKGYDYVLMKGVGGSVMYGRNTLDITEETLKALNEAYQESKK